ncbi:hypothetical protein LCGC14_2686010, partial [marine sediment metagenome]
MAWNKLKPAGADKIKDSDDNILIYHCIPTMQKRI